MKVMAIGTLKPMTPEQRKQFMPEEVPATLKLYLEGKMEQFWLRDQMQGVFFLMNVDSVEEATKLLNALPLTKGGMMSYQFMPVGPLLALGMLIK